MNRAMPRGTLFSCIFMLSQLFTTQAFAAEPSVTFKVSTEQAQALDIKTETLARSGGVITRRFPAQVVLPANAEHVTSSPVPGLVTDILVEPHQQVEAGTPVARLVSQELGELQLQLLQAATRSTLASQSAEREQQLFKEGIIAQRRVQEAQADLAQAKAALHQTKAALRLGGMSAAAIEQVAASGVPQDSITLAAAKAGVVTEILVGPGQRVEQTTALLHVADTRVLWLDIQVAAADLANWPPGSTLTVTGRAVTGHVRSSSPMVSADSQMAILRAEVDGGTDTLRPGEVVAVELPAGGGKDSWNIPLSAVAHDGDQAYVFVRAGDGFEDRPVTVIDSAGVRVRVEGALNASDQVAVSGVVALKGAWLEAKEAR